MTKMFTMYAVWCVGLLAFCPQVARACTGIRLIAGDGSVIYARTMEFVINTNSSIIIIPRRYNFIGILPSGKPDGLSWQSKFAAVGANALKTHYIMDGFNERGLGGGYFYFAGLAEYQDVSLNENQKTLGSWQLLTWILTNFATVQEAVNALPSIRVGKAIFEGWDSTPPPFHMILHDASGKSAVVEYTNGGMMHIYNNPIGVITNAPTFNWHMTNLRNYIHLKPLGVPHVEFAGIKIFPMGQGAGMLGLPGDFTPPSRFVRAVEFSQSSLPMKTGQDAIKQAFHVLNQFDIPLGAVRSQDGNKISYDYTQWTSASDLKNKKYYFHTFDNRQLHVVDLLKANLDARMIEFISMNRPEKIIDLTPVYKKVNNQGI